MITEYVNGKVLLNNKFRKQNFVIYKGKIFLKYDHLHPTKTIDLTGKYVAPGFFDIHVHTRVPGFEKKDDLKHVQESAMVGGVTQFIAMPNTNPMPYNVKILTSIQKMMDESIVNIFQAARITNNNKVVNFATLSKKQKFFSDDGNPVKTSKLMTEALLQAKKHDSILFLHENDPNIAGYAYTSKFSQKYNIKSFSSEYETNIIKRDIELNKEINAKIHIQHISTKEGVQLYKAACKSGMNISAELTPHHLCLNNEDIVSDDSNYKMNPPLGSKKDQKYLIKAFKKGIINIIATDHAPHSILDKKGGFNKAAFGVINLESAFASIYTLLGKRYLLKIVKAYSINPASLVNIDVNIYNNEKANIVIIDPSYKWTFTKKDIKSKSINSPFINKTFVGKIVKTIYGTEERDMGLQSN